MTTTPERRYRFAQRDRTGWVLGLNGIQVTALAIATFESGLLLDAGCPLWFVLIPLVLATLFSFARWNGRPLHQQLPANLRWLAVHLLGTRRWEAEAGSNALPPFLCGFDVIDVQAPAWVLRIDNGGVGVVVDHRDRTISATLPVRSRQFTLCERSEQERLLEGWGDALGAFASERGTVCRVTWNERAARSSARTPQSKRLSRAESSPGLVSYLELTDSAKRDSIVHETTVTITVDLRRVHGKSRGKKAAIATGCAALTDELRLLSLRLADAGLDVDAPLSADELHHAICARLDPDPSEVSTGRTLAQLAGLEPPRSGPRTAVLEWNWVRVDGSVHHTYGIAEWPRLDVGPGWLEPLLLHGGATRTISVFAEPVPPSRSRRQIERDATKLATDSEQRTRAGFRIGAEHERVTEGVLERESELTSGYVEFTYVGLVTITAADVETLQASCLEYEQVASQCGLVLESLDASHDLGLVCSLPLGRGPARQRLAS